MLKYVSWFILLFGLLFISGLIHFMRLIPTKKPISMHITTDAIVVLTGGKNRIEMGIKLLAENPSKLLFITGMETKTKRIKALPNNIKSKVNLGQLASTTQENAAETKPWVDKNKITSITLVTANYHMPRSLLEFKHAMPTIKIESYSVFTSGFRLNKWWKHLKTIKLLCKEYVKYLIVNVRYTLRLSRNPL